MKIKEAVLVEKNDSVCEMLSFVLDFTCQRHEILIRNIDNVNDADYIPKDLAVQEFASTMDASLLECILNKRFVFVDSDNFKFNCNGSFDAYAVEDIYARELFENNIDRYLEHQKTKIAENTLNYRQTRELLEKQRSIILS